MTHLIQQDNPNLLLLTSDTGIYFNNEDFLMPDDTLIIQDGRKSESTYQVVEVYSTSSKAIKTGFTVAHLSLNK